MYGLLDKLMPRFGVAALILVGVSLSLPHTALAACGGDLGSLVGSLPEEMIDALGKDKSGKGQNSCKGAPASTPKKAKKTPLVQTTYYGGGQAIEGKFVPDEVLATIKGGRAEAEEIAARLGLSVRSFNQVSVLGASLVRFGISSGQTVAGVRGLLNEIDTVMRAAANHIYELNGKHKGKPRYSLKSAGVVGLKDQTQGRGIKIAIIDTDVDGEHPALKNAIRARYNALKDAPLNSKAHGTAIALLAAGNAPFVGAAPEAELYVARAFDLDDGGRTINSADAVLLSLDWAFRQDVDVINMSFAGAENDLVLEALRNLATQNIILVGAAGNYGAKAPYAFPAASPHVFAVTAIDAKNRIYTKANRGPYIFVAAPGVDVLVTEGEDKLRFESGTSYGAALFSGIAALLIERLPDVTVDEFRKIIEKSAKDLGEPGRDKTFGVGLVRANEMLRQIQKH